MKNEGNGEKMEKKRWEVGVGKKRRYRFRTTEFFVAYRVGCQHVLWLKFAFVRS